MAIIKCIYTIFQVEKVGGAAWCSFGCQLAMRNYLKVWTSTAVAVSCHGCVMYHLNCGAHRERFHFFFFRDSHLFFFLFFFFFLTNICICERGYSLDKTIKENHRKFSQIEWIDMLFCSTTNIHFRVRDDIAREIFFKIPASSSG